MPVLLSELRTRCRQRTDVEHSTSDLVGSGELDQLINSAGKKLWSILTRHKINPAENNQTITPTGALSYTLAADFLSCIAIFRVQGTVGIPLQRHDWRYKLDTNLTGPAVSYRIFGHSEPPLIEFDPIPQTGDDTYTVRYVPLYTPLVLASDGLNGVNGWEEYIVCDVAYEIHNKESNLAQAQAQLDARKTLELQIKDDAAAVEMTQSMRVQDIRFTHGDPVWAEGAYIGRRGVRGSGIGAWWRRW